MTKEKEKALNLLFTENKEDVNKNQDYKNNFKEYSLPVHYYLVEMYNKQKELQKFLADKGKTCAFPELYTQVKQSDVQLAIYHLFCMQVEKEELLAELDKCQSGDDEISAKYELIDMFFFMFNVGIYTGLDINKVFNNIVEDLVVIENTPYDHSFDKPLLEAINTSLTNYIDKLPWKAWKDYDYNTFYLKLGFTECYIYYAQAVLDLVKWAKRAFNQDLISLYNFYMNKWEENKRRQEDLTSGYVLNTTESIQ